jgi:hypothetical protein
MAVADQIHWSFQYDGRSQAPLFGERLIEIMQDAVVEELADKFAIVDRYLVLPNYWKGYRGRGLEAGDYKIEIGEVVIDRKQIASGNWTYDVRFLNLTSGEDLRLHFECLDNAFCTLTDEWKVSVVNGANHGYRDFACDGKLTALGDQQQITLTVNSVDLPSGKFNSTDPVTCNWTLFDVIPNLADVMKNSGERVSLTMLEDLEKVRENTRIGFMESFDLQVGDDVVRLDGFFNYGEGTLSSYWWLDQQGVVRIASTVFQTFVLISRKAGGWA